MQQNNPSSANNKSIDYISFRKKCIEQNSDRNLYLSIAVVIFYGIINGIWYFSGVSDIFPRSELYRMNLNILFVLGLTVISVKVLSSKFYTLKSPYLKQFTAVSMSIIVLSITSMNSFMVSLEPNNHLTPMLVGSVIVAGLYRFNIWESMLVFIFGFSFFIGLNFFFDADPLDIAMNVSVTAAIYTTAFLINRGIITNAYKYHTQLRFTEAINNSLKNAIRQKNEVLSIVAHDLRNPINNIKQISNILKEEKQNMETIEQFVPLIEESCVNAENVINDLLAIAKIKNTSKNMESICLNVFLNDLYQQLKPHYPNHQFKFISPEKNLYISAYPDKLQRIVQNLLSNAFKFTPENKAIELKLSESEGKNTITIRDEGIGIPENQQEQIFNKFNNSSRDGLKGEPSVGLGLFIVKELTEMMEGHISLESQEGIGSIFQLSFDKAK